jgi:hypothetical protein
MPLPEGFDEWEHLQDQVRREHNKAVQAYFKNQPDDDISTPKRSLKQACLMKDEDTATMTMMRMWLFEVTVGHAQSLQRPVYGIPVSEVQENWKFKPQVKLYFVELFDNETHGNGLPQAEGEITFRLMNKTSETITRADAERLARNIKNEIATPPLIWEKGWYKATYLDPEHGYDLRLLVKNKAEAEKVIRKVVAIQDHVFERDYFQFIEHDRTYSLNPGTHLVYGKTVKKPVKRRRANVKFRYAQLLIHGKPNAINLVSISGVRLQSVIERV